MNIKTTSSYFAPEIFRTIGHSYERHSTIEQVEEYEMMRLESEQTEAENNMALMVKENHQQLLEIIQLVYQRTPCGDLSAQWLGFCSFLARNTIQPPHMPLFVCVAGERQARVALTAPQVQALAQAHSLFTAAQMTQEHTQPTKPSASWPFSCSPQPHSYASQI